MTRLELFGLESILHCYSVICEHIWSLEPLSGCTLDKFFGKRSTRRFKLFNLSTVTCQIVYTVDRDTFGHLRIVWHYSNICKQTILDLLIGITFSTLFIAILQLLLGNFYLKPLSFIYVLYIYSIFMLQKSCFIFSYLKQ